MKRILIICLLALSIFKLEAQDAGSIALPEVVCKNDTVTVFSTVPASVPADHTYKYGFLYRTNKNGYAWIETDTVPTVTLFTDDSGYFEVIRVVTAFNFQGSQYVLYSLPVTANTVDCSSTGTSIEPSPVKKIVAVYDILGRPINKNTFNGLVFVKYSDGSVRVLK